MPAACRVLGDIGDDVEPELIEQRAIVGFVQAGMIERLAAITADRLAVARPAGEHQRRPGRGVRAEDRKHPALIIAGEMEELSQARMPSKRRSRDKLRMSATTQP